MNRRKPAPVHRPGRRLGVLALLLSAACQSDLQTTFAEERATGSANTGGDAPPGDVMADDDGADDDDATAIDDGGVPDDDGADDDVSNPEDDDAPESDDDGAVSSGGGMSNSGDDDDGDPGDDDVSVEPGDDGDDVPASGDDDAPFEPGDDDGANGDDDLAPLDDDGTAPDDDAPPADDDAPSPEPAPEPSGPDGGVMPSPAAEAGVLPEPEPLDDCPDDPSKTEPGVCGCGVPDEDSDDDGALDCEEDCPGDDEKTEPLLCGCGVAETDGDDDGTPDCDDECPDDPEKTAPGDCGCGASDESGGNTVAQCLELSGALVHRYRFAGSGATAMDDVGDADGALVGTTLTGTGSVNLSTGPYVDLPNDVLDGLANATFEVWVRRGSLTDAFQRILDFGDSGIEGESNLGQTYIFLTPRTTPEKGDAVRLTYYNGVNEVALTGATSLPLRAASHVAAVFDDDGDRMLLYVNGSVVAQGTWTDQLADINAINSWLGRSQFIADPGFDGSIDEFRIYDAALDAEQLEYSIAAGTDPPFLD